MQNRVALLVVTFLAGLLAGCATSAPPAIADRPPVVRVMIPPVYPVELRGTGLKGHVVIEYVIDTAGNVAKIQVNEESHPLFGRAAMAAVLRWKFLPGLKAGVPANVRTIQTLDINWAMPPAAK